MTERINISVPKDVAKAMRRRSDTNWSQIATGAFRRVLCGESKDEEILRLKLEILKLQDRISKAFTILDLGNS